MKFVFEIATDTLMASVVAGTCAHVRKHHHCNGSYCHHHCCWVQHGGVHQTPLIETLSNAAIKTTTTIEAMEITKKHIHSARRNNDRR